MHLYAVVPAAEAGKLPERRSISTLACGPVAALFDPLRPSRPGAPGNHAVRVALRHDRIVGLALAACSSVVPFRLGLPLGSAAELLALLDLNSRQLTDQLARFRGRVEMGLKARLFPSVADPAALLPPCATRGTWAPSSCSPRMGRSRPRARRWRSTPMTTSPSRSVSNS